MSSFSNDQASQHSDTRSISPNPSIVRALRIYKERLIFDPHPPTPTKHTLVSASTSQYTERHLHPKFQQISNTIYFHSTAYHHQNFIHIPQNNNDILNKIWTALPHPLLFQRQEMLNIPQLELEPNPLLPPTKTRRPRRDIPSQTITSGKHPPFHPDN